MAATSTSDAKGCKRQVCDESRDVTAASNVLAAKQQQSSKGHMDIGSPPPSKRLCLAVCTEDIEALNSRLALAQKAALTSNASQHDGEHVNAKTEEILRGKLAEMETKMDTVEAQRRITCLNLANAQARCRAAKCLRDEVVGVVHALKPALVDLEEVVQEAADLHRRAKDQVDAWKEGIVENMDADLVKLHQHLASMQQNRQQLEAKYEVAESARCEAEAQVLRIEEKSKVSKMASDHEEAAHATLKQAAVVQVEVEAREAETTLLEAAMLATFDKSLENDSLDAETRCTNVLERRQSELAKLLKEQRRRDAALQEASGCVAEAAVAKPAAQDPGVRSPAVGLSLQAAKRLIVSSKAVPQISDEFRLLFNTVNNRPVWKAASCLKNMFLLWVPRDGGCWLFTSDVENLQASLEKDNVVLDAVPMPLMRSLQLAVTALPEELMPTSWMHGGWGERIKERTCVSVFRA